MDEQHRLAQRFEESRPRLRKIAFRMLGSEADADDAVQETWLRLSRIDAERIDNLAGWLTTVVARICLDMLRSRTTRREESLDLRGSDRMVDADTADPEEAAILADSIGPALLIVLDTLSPSERVALVLHDMFGVPFKEIAAIIGCTATASRQLASRARRRLRGALADKTDTGQRQDRRLVDAFLKAAREGDLETLLGVLHPECRLRADEFAALIGAPKEIAGGTNVADFFNGGADDARRATINGVAAAAWAPNGKLRVAFSFTFRDDRIVDIELIADRKRLQRLHIEFLDR